MHQKKNSEKSPKTQWVDIVEEDEFGFPVTTRKEIVVEDISADSDEEDEEDEEEEEEKEQQRKRPPSSSSSSSSSSKKSASPFTGRAARKKVAMEMITPMYQVGKRSDSWRKLKVDYIDGAGVCDSLDVVPIGECLVWTHVLMLLPFTTPFECR